MISKFKYVPNSIFSKLKKKDEIHDQVLDANFNLRWFQAWKMFASSIIHNFSTKKHELNFYNYEYPRNEFWGSIFIIIGLVIFDQTSLFFSVLTIRSFAVETATLLLWMVEHDTWIVRLVSKWTATKSSLIGSLHSLERLSRSTTS